MVEQGSSFVVVETGSIPIVALGGVIDLATRDEIWDRLAVLLDGTRAGLMVDLGKVTFMDSRGLSILVRACEALEEDRAVTLVDVPAAVRRSLALAGIDERFQIVSTPEAWELVGDPPPRGPSPLPPLIG